jgi:hypothetical protein
MTFEPIKTKTKFKKDTKMNQPINGLLQKEVSRKEFLGIGGLAVASIFGFGTVIKLLTGKSLASNKHLATVPISYGYGSSAYGGRKEPR